MTATDDIPSNPHLSVETACTLLARAERRTVVWYFIDQETDTANLDELVEHVHEEVETITTSDHARISLVHTHLPKLAEHGVIDYDHRSETVRYRDGSRLETLLEMTADEHST